jgi:hypothetical protein
MVPKRDWLETTFEDIAGVDTSRGVAMLPVAAVEQYGQAVSPTFLWQRTT